MSTTLINGNAQETIHVTDRGLQYGDGLFETIAVRNGNVLLWDKHWQRMVSGCEKLAIICPDRKLVENEITTLVEHIDHNQQVSEIKKEQFVLKIIVTRGNTERGYRFVKDMQATRILSAYTWPDYPEEYKSKGVSVRYCITTVSENKSLAGIKHLNRLEQVLARSEWDDEYQEGLMCNMKGNVVDGTMSNLFIVKNGQLLTPDISNSGVAGIMRQTVMEFAKETSITVRERDLTKNDVEQAEEVFLTNSLFGIWPVSSISKTHVKPVGDITRQLQKRLTEFNGLSG